MRGGGCRRQHWARCLGFTAMAVHSVRQSVPHRCQSLTCGGGHKYPQQQLCAQVQLLLVGRSPCGGGGGRRQHWACYLGFAVGLLQWLSMACSSQSLTCRGAQVISATAVCASPTTTGRSIPLRGGGSGRRQHWPCYLGFAAMAVHGVQQSESDMQGGTSNFSNSCVRKSNYYW